MTDEEMRYLTTTLPEIPAPPGWAWTPWMFWGEYQTYDGTRLVVRELWPITRDQKLRAGYRDRAEITELDLERNPGPPARADLALAKQDIAALCVVNSALNASVPPID